MIIIYSGDKRAVQAEWLPSQGCTFVPGKGGHQGVRLGDRKSVIPMHGSNKELGKGLVEKIKKDLGVK